MTPKDLKDYFGIVANIAAIITAIVAVSAWGYYRWNLRRKRRRLENYLKAIWNNQRLKNKGRTLISLSAALAMTEADIMQAAFDSNRVRRRPKEDQNGNAVELLLEYKDSK
jgi:hypothetical protein